MSQVFFSPSAQYCSAIDVVGPNGLGLYSGKSLDEFIFERGDVSIVDQDVAVEYDRNRRMTPVTEISEERFHDMLECLPPCKWHRTSSAEAFHMSERITYDIVDWFVRIGDKFYTFADTDSISAAAAIDKASVTHFKEQA